MTRPSRDADSLAVYDLAVSLGPGHGPDCPGDLCRLILEALRNETADWFAHIRRRQFVVVVGEAS